MLAEFPLQGWHPWFFKIIIKRKAVVETTYFRTFFWEGWMQDSVSQLHNLLLLLPSLRACPNTHVSC